MDQPYQPDNYGHKYPPPGAKSPAFTDKKEDPKRLEPLLYSDTFPSPDETSTERSQQPQRRITDNHATVALHAALILQYLVLIAVWVPHWEHKTTIGLSGRSDLLRAMVTQLQALAAAAYSTLLVFMTQRQALRVHLSVRQTLTSLHDCLTAWIGLGSALLIVGYQARLPSGARYAVVAITTYLVSIFVYHTAAPTLFDLSPYNATEPVRFNVISHHPNDILYDLPFDFLRSMAMFPTMSTPGLFGADTVFDTRSNDSAGQYGVGYLTVHQTVFDTSCTLISGSQTSYNSNSDATSSSPTWNITLEDKRTYSLGKTRPSTIRILPVPLDENNHNATSKIVTVMLSSAVNVPSVSNHWFEWVETSTASLSPNMTYDDDPHHQTSAVSFLDCSLKHSPGTATINTDNRYFTEKIEAKLPKLSLSDYPWEETWSQLMSWGFSQNSTWNPASLTFNEASSLWAPAPTLSNTEVLLLQAAGVSSWDSDPDSSITIIQPKSFGKFLTSDIEGYLTEVTAKMFWTAANVGQSTLDQATTPQSDNSTSNGVVLVTRLRLNISTVALFVGLVSSIAATVLSYLLIWPPRITAQVPIPRAIDTAGLLQWTHLLGHGGRTERIANVEPPTVANLRGAGMEVPWEGLRRRT